MERITNENLILRVSDLARAKGKEDAEHLQPGYYLPNPYHAGDLRNKPWREGYLSVMRVREPKKFPLPQID